MLDNPENGQVEVDGQTVGRNATYTCNDGFVIEGVATRFCGPDGQWIGEAPICIREALIHLLLYPCTQCISARYV